MSGDWLEAWELKLGAKAVMLAMLQWADALGDRADLLTLWGGTPALACEAIERVVVRRGKELCLVLAHDSQFSTAAFLREVQCEWDHYRYDFINAVLKELGIEYVLE